MFRDIYRIRVTEKFCFFLLLSVFLFSCSKEPVREQKPPPDPPPPADTTNYKYGFFIVNEGNFNWGNASVTFIDSATGLAEQDIYQLANNRPLGDVAQSMKVFRERAFIVVNNSNKVEVVNLRDFESVKSIEGFNSPRYIEFVDSAKAYVTNLHKDISVIDLNTLTVTHSIPTPEWTEGMVRYQQYMFVTCVGSFNEPNSKRKAKVLIINTKEDRIVDSIQTGKEPMGIVIDKKLKLWVLCSGGWDGYEPPVLVRINPDLREVEKAFIFPTSAEIPDRLAINPSGDTLYYLKNGIFQMAVNSASLPTQAFIPSSGRLFYGLAIHPIDGTIFATDAIDYVQDGKGYEFSSSTGAQINVWQAGRIPGSFCFGQQQNRKTIQ
jgi:YVTN family beta-propeller protein